MTERINKCLIFSKNRAAQLDTLLRSMEDFLWMDSWEISILGYYEEGIHKDTWELLKSKWQGVEFIDEQKGEFERQVRKFIDSDMDNIMFMVDDGIFLNKCEKLTYQIPAGGSISYRLGYEMLKYSKLSADHYHWYFTCEAMKQEAADWRYPFSVDAHAYNINDIRDILKTVTFKNPNTFEDNIYKFHKDNKVIESCRCMRTPSFVNFPLNVVQDIDYKVKSVDELRLAELFFHGYELYYPERPLITNPHMDINFILMKNGDKSEILELK